MSSLFPKMEGVIAKISKTNALYPLLIALIISVGIVSIVFFCSENTLLRLISLMLPLVIVYRIDRSFLYFSENNPDMLRSETHSIQKQALSIIGDESNDFSDRTSAIIAVLNPNNPLKEGDRVEFLFNNKDSSKENGALEL